MFFPDIRHFAQHVSVVVHAGRRLNAKSMKFGCVWEDGFALVIFKLGEARNNSAAITEYAHCTALPVAFFGLV